jgi:hypothetical protein
MISGMVSQRQDKVSACTIPPGLEKESTLRLGVVAGSLEAQPEGLRFQCAHGDKTVQCGIVDTALLDLIGFHRIKQTEDNPFRVLLPEIKRLVNAKHDAGVLRKMAGSWSKPSTCCAMGSGGGRSRRHDNWAMKSSVCCVNSEVRNVARRSSNLERTVRGRPRRDGCIACRRPARNGRGTRGLH